MCGFVGFVGPQKLDLTRPLALVRHRGPDHQEQNYSRVNDIHVGLAHARLSILDLSESGNQPFQSADATIRLVFNGEIYNHNQLRKKLIKLGRNFLTNSDTEVVMQLYEQFGVDCFKYLNGIFAIALVDLKKQRIVLARDHFGVKPLFYSYSDTKGIGFSSEIPALKALLGKEFEIDEAFLAEFIANGFLYEPNTGRRALHKVPPGHYIMFTFEKYIETRVCFYMPNLFAGDKCSLDDVLSREIELQCQADVKLGIFFSGGIDSAIIAAKAPHSVLGLFAEYEPKNLDSIYVDSIADRLGIKLMKARLRSEPTVGVDPLADFQMVAEGMDELNSNFTYVATRELSALSRQRGFKVMLSGMGADEMFLGYPRHALGRYWKILKLLRNQSSLIQFVSEKIRYFDRKSERLTTFLSADHFIEAYTSLVGYFSGHDICRLLGVGSDWKVDYRERLYRTKAYDPDRGVLDNMHSLDRYGYISMNLAYTDRASMREGVEVRVPYLSPAIDEYCQRRGQRSTGKSDLKNILASKIGRKLVNRTKVGFNPPLKKKIDLIGMNGLRNIFDGSKIKNYMNMDEVRKILRTHFSGERDESNKLNQLIFLSLWLEKN